MTGEKSVYAPSRRRRGDGRLKRKVAQPLKAAVLAAVTVALGYLFASAKAPFDTYPFSIALAASAASNPVLVALGILLRLIFSEESREAIFPFCAAACIVCIARYAVALIFSDRYAVLTTGRISDGIFLRVALAAAGSFSSALMLMIIYGYEPYYLACGAFSACCSGALTFLMSAVFDKRYYSAPAFEAGAAATMLVTVLSISGSHVFSVAPAYIFAFAATLYCAYAGGAARGCALGFLLGLGCGGGLCPTLALFGLCGGLFFSVSTIAASAAALIAAICFGVGTAGADEVLGFLPEALIGTAAVTVPAIAGILPVKFVTSERSGASLALCRNITEKKRREENIMKIELLSRAMEALSQMMKNLSDKMRKPDEYSLEKMCREVWREKCDGCPNDCACKDIDSLCGDDRFKRIISKLMTVGRLEADRISEMTKAQCPKRDEIIDEINLRTAKLTEYALKFDKSQIFAFDYEAMSKLLSGAVLQSSAGYPIDKILSDKVRKSFVRSGIPADNVMVCGDRKKYIVATGPAISATAIGSDDIREICETVCKTKFAKPEFAIENGCTAVTLESARTIGTEYYSKQLEKHGELVCGDEVSTVESDEGYLYCIICDGMGSGEQAALASRICKIFLEKMLVCGNDKTTTLKMLNMFLKNKGTECFATVDLLEIDLHLGTASFIKSGAAPSYIMRGGRLFRIASGTLPVGILDDISAELTEFELQVGDVIIMASDGISGDFEAESETDPSWFADFLCREWTDDLSVMTEKILVASQRNGRRIDDMTVELIRICPPDREPEYPEEFEKTREVFSA